MKFAKALCCIATAATASILGMAHAQDRPVELKFGYWVPPAHALIPATQQWGESVTKASNGSIKVTIYPSEQLGKAFDHYDMSRDGIADLALVNPGYQPGRFPVIAASELPFIFSNAIAGSRAFDEWYRKYAPREMKDVKVCLGFGHDPGSFHFTKKKVVLPSDMKGMKVRPANATIASYITLLGGTTVQASAAEMRDVLEKGVADGTASPWESILLFKADSLLKFHIEEPIYVATFLWTMNRDKYAAMSAAQKKVIDDHCTPEWAERIAKPWAEREFSGHAKLRAAGHDVYRLSPADVAAWKKAAEPLNQRWADAVKKAGFDPQAVMNDLLATVKKYNALY
jgi:TRAP-type C4-dicarboxylate transport system substrate-binding protein